MADRIDILRESIIKAGNRVKKASPTEGIIEKEGRANFVTGADLASERVLMDYIRTHFPEDYILSEETDAELGDVTQLDHLWVLDPIDGTKNFRDGRGYSAVSVAYVEKGEPVLGAAYNPFTNELFFAEKGKGSFLNDTRLRVGQEKSLENVSIATDNSYAQENARKMLEVLQKLEVVPWIRINGSAVLEMCEVAAGQTDLFFHISLKPWDNAAAFLIAEEAGAVVKGIDGSTINFTSPHMIVGNAPLVEQFIKQVST